MLNIVEARTHDVRGLAAAVSLGSIIGLAGGGAYLAGDMARARLQAPVAPTVAPIIASPHAGLAATTPRGVTAPRPVEAGVALARVRDRRCLAQAVYYEARGESASGQAAVAQVVLNRVGLDTYADSVCGVVFQRRRHACQFSFACDGAMHGALEVQAWRRAQAIAERALSGVANPLLRHATIFQAADARMDAALSRGVMRVAQIGAHVFYRQAAQQSS